MSLIIEYNKKISDELSKPEAMASLLQTTFKGFKDEKLVKQAILEGMTRGFQITDFFKKKIYAIPFKVYNSYTKQKEDAYTLVESIGNVRAIAMNNGQTGKSKPEFEYNTNETIKSCSVTIYKKDGHENGYTATVFFSEFEKPASEYNGKVTPGMWQLKSHNMIAKVAEMHALRMAFPEYLGESYVEEEFQKEETIRYEEPETNVDEPPTELDDVQFQATIKTLKQVKTIKTLETFMKDKLPKSKYDKIKKQQIQELIEQRIKEITDTNT